MYLCHRLSKQILKLTSRKKKVKNKEIFSSEKQFICLKFIVTSCNLLLREVLILVGNEVGTTGRCRKSGIWGQGTFFLHENLSLKFFFASSPYYFFLFFEEKLNLKFTFLSDRIFVRQGNRKTCLSDSIFSLSENLVPVTGFLLVIQKLFE